MRMILTLALSTVLAACALAQQPDPRGAARPTQPPGTRGGGFGGSFGGSFGGIAAGPQTLEQKLAMLEAMSESLTRQIKSIRSELEKPANLKVFRLQYMNAVNGSKLLGEIFARDGSVRVNADERTNSLIVYADKDWMEVVQSLVKNLDIEKPSR